MSGGARPAGAQQIVQSLQRCARLPALGDYHRFPHPSSSTAAAAAAAPGAGGREGFEEGIVISSTPIKRKAPYGECDAAESTGWTRTSPGFIQEAGSPHMTPISRESARTYQSKAKCTNTRFKMPISNAGKYKSVWF
ncbi:hypothetical protein U9M48_032488 [Paspalum notatum var. saurae]|uniref:Uncharacterized protein n=1 Tax=Paspalum notatum var. saurae TaxID=547442 RepID=A0AAQ3U571_PASNO